MPADLICPSCGETYEYGPSEPWRCKCGNPLEFDAHPLPDRSRPPDPDPSRHRGLWEFEEFIPITPSVTLGEGYTPLVETPTWAAEFKLEYVFPSGSFKDRGATTTLSRASELGVSEIVEDSSGNAGAAIAMYAARADVDAEIFVPATAKEAKLRAIESAGATTNRVAGTREEVTEACIEAVETGDIWYASHAWNPAFFAGTKTFALEVAAQRDWTAPDAVVIGVGHGTLFLGAYRGFKSLYKAGWIDRMPQMLAAQADGYAPIVESVRGDYRAESTNELADGIQIADPPRGHQIVDAIEATGGDAIALTDAEVKETLTRLHREGFYTEPTCAVAPAAIKKYRSAGVLDESEDVVVPLTGSGLKS